MKKLLLTISIIIAGTIGLSSTVFAACPENGCPNGEVCDVGICKSLIEVLTGRPGKTSGTDVGKNPETEAVADLPNVGIEGAITSTVKIILGWAMSITLVTLVVSAIYYIQSRGNEEDVKKAKDMMLYLIIGMAIMAAAYGLVSGLSQFKFFGEAQAYTIDPTYAPDNTPFTLEENTKARGAENSTVIILQIIAGALLYFAAPIAIIMISFNAFNMVMFGAESEKLEQSKKGLTWAALGLLAIILSYSITRAIIGFVINAAQPPTG